MSRDQRIQDFYESAASGDQSLFALWEHGLARGDSVTAATWCLEYRRWMVQLLQKLLLQRQGASLLSIGCGNAVVEGELVTLGHGVSAVDICATAVKSARDRGVVAHQANILDWPSETRFDVIYSDGVVGHLFERASGFRAFFSVVRRLLIAEGVLVLSNDAGPHPGQDVWAHPNVPEFFLFSPAYLARELTTEGFAVVGSEVFRYTRPLSGERIRSVLVARNAGTAVFASVDT